MYDASISWDAASRAQGYSVKIYWLEEGQPLTSTVDVKKDGKNFVFSTKGAHYGTGLIAKDEKSFIIKGSKKKFTSSKLSFQVTGNGSCIWITKVEIKSYRVVSGKKVYSKVVTKKVPMN